MKLSKSIEGTSQIETNEVNSELISTTLFLPEWVHIRRKPSILAALICHFLQVSWYYIIKNLIQLISGYIQSALGISTRSRPQS